LVKGIVDAHLSSQEETIFGNLLEGFAIYVSAQLWSGFKSQRKSLDLEFQRDGKYYIVGIKSSANWGNADQISALKASFKQARLALRAEGVTQEIVAVNGCIYGKERHPLKDKRGRRRIAEDPDKVYYKYAGQDFWLFISGDDNLYREIIAPLGAEARQKDEVFKKAYTAKINEMTLEFLQNFMAENQIDWLKLIDYVSQRDAEKPPLAFGELEAE
jgi:site-specific DNA-methyltransferase (cytosine-N4-specific)